MKLELDSNELSDLREAVQSYSARLLGELARADQREYRDMLRQKVRHYEALITRLSGPNEVRAA